MCHLGFTNMAGSIVGRTRWRSLRVPPLRTFHGRMKNVDADNSCHVAGLS